jgi:hypothetical protein
VGEQEDGQGGLRTRLCKHIHRGWLREYRAIGYARGEAPLGCAEPKDDLSSEYDDDVRPFLDHESASDQSDEFPEWVP